MQFQDQWDRHEKPPFTPGTWHAYDPCYGTCGFGSMPCTPDGCHENHPVGVRCVSGPPGNDGDIELETEADAFLIAAAPGLFAALDAAPVIRLGESFEEFGVRYRRWYREMRVPALKKAYGLEG